MDKKFRKNTVWNMIGTGINAFNSLFLMIIVTRMNGVFDAGIFTFAFSTATLFNVIGVYAGRIYQVTDGEDITDKEYLMNRVISCIIMMLISLIFIAIRHYNFTKQIIILLLCFLKMLEAFSDVLYAFFQKRDDLYQVGISLTIKNLVGLGVFMLVDYFTKNLIFALLAFILTFIIVIIFYDCKQLHLKEKLLQRCDLHNVVNIFIKGFSTFCISFLTIYLINASKYAIDAQMTDDIQAIFGIIVMPATVMILIAQFVIHPFLNMISKEIKDRNYKNLVKLIVKISLFIFGVGILAIIGCYFVGIPILEFIYGLSLSEYSLCLSVILLGATFYALTSVLNTVLIAMRHTFIQMVIYGGLAVAALISSRLFVSYYEIMGASINYFLIMFVSFILFLLTFIIIIKKESYRNKAKEC